jgi:predicted nucleic acid-binding protein
MKYLLDTNILSYLEEQASPFHVKSKECLSRLSDDDEIFIPILILYELRYSVSAAPQEKSGSLKALVRSYLKQFPILHLTGKGAEIFGDIKTGASKTGPRGTIILTEIWPYFRGKGN